jgi:hypothetical protein
MTGAAAINGAIEVVRGRLTDERAGQLLDFWAHTGALDEAAARERLPEVVCVLMGDDGRLEGANSVYAADVPLLGGRRFWIYRSLLPGATGEARDAMFRAAFEALEAEFDGATLGVCLAIADRGEMERRPEAEWRDPRTLYAGYLDDGRQLRVAYFAGARIGPGSTVTVHRERPLEPGYRIERFAQQDAVGAQDVIDFWLREGAMPAEEAQRRVDEVLLVALTDADELAGVSSTYLQRNAQLRMDLWYYRAFVAAAHRISSIAIWLALIGREMLQERFVGGEDRRAAGLLFEVENEGLKRYFNEAIWGPTDVAFIGENAFGAHVRVRYFPGARAPLPA